VTLRELPIAPRARRIRDKLPDAFVLSLVVVVTGCAVQAPRPVEVSLDRSALAMRLSDGSRCTAPVTPVPGRYSTTVAGAGTFADCAAPFRYTVTGDPGTNPLRFVLEEAFTAIGLPDAIAPRATVEIAAPDGRSWTFASPPEPDDT
jgi:hypothetical protein